MNSLYQKNENILLREAVIRAIVFFDLFNYPLTRWEIWQNLPIEINCFGRIFL